MTIDPKQRITKHTQLSEGLKILYEAPESGELYLSVFSKYVVDRSLYNSYINIIGDTILGFYKTTDLPKLFQQHLMVGADQAQRMTSELLEFLSPVIAREEAESNIKKEDIAKLAETFEKAAKEKPQTTSEVNDTKEEEVEKPKPETEVSEVENIKPLRTMQDDINRIHGYGAYRDQNPLSTEEGSESVVVASNQESLLQKTKPVAEMPKYEKE